MAHNFTQVSVLIPNEKIINCMDHTHHYDTLFCFQININPSKFFRNVDT